MRIKIDISLKLSEIANAVSGTIYGVCQDEIIEYITTDSRECYKGDLFVAIEGERNDGEGFVDIAISLGAIPLCRRKAQKCIQVTDTIAALQLLAGYYKSLLTNLKYTIGITGSVGKTTTTRISSKLISDKYITHSTYGNQNNQIGLPMTILKSPQNTEVIVAELGMNHSGEISRLSKCLSPDIAIITNIGSAHIGNLGSRENIASAKLEILSGLRNGTLIIPFGEPLLENAYEKSVTFSGNNFHADYCAKVSKSGSIELYKNKSLRFKEHISHTFEHYSEDFAAAYAVAETIGVEENSIKKQFSVISDIIMRQSIISINDFFILDDSYNASYESIIAAFRLLNSLQGYSKKSIMLGSVLELGDLSEVIHFKIGMQAGKFGFDKLFFFGEFAKTMMMGARYSGIDKHKIFLNSDSNSPEISARQIENNVQHNEIILFKASHAVNIAKIYKDYLK